MTIQTTTLYQSNLQKFAENPELASRLHEEITINYPEKIKQLETSQIVSTFATAFIQAFITTVITSIVPYALPMIAIWTGSLYLFHTFAQGIDKACDEQRQILNDLQDLTNGTPAQIVSTMLSQHRHVHELSDFTAINPETKNLYTAVIAKEKYWKEKFVAQNEKIQRLESANAPTPTLDKEKRKLVEARVNEAFMIYVLQNPLKVRNSQNTLVSKKIEDFGSFDGTGFKLANGEMRTYTFFESTTLATASLELFGTQIM